MKFMETINKIQAALTELRREIQWSEAPKVGDDVLHQAPSWYCTCPTEIPCPAHDRNYQELKGKIGDTFNPTKPTPDLPLHVRVAKALGYAVWTDHEGNWRSFLGRFIPEGVTYPTVPDYPNDLVAAMGALEEYSRKTRSDLRVYRKAGMEFYTCRIDMENRSQHESLPQAICEAIVAHAEGK